MNDLSLRLRLALLMSGALLFACITASLLAYHETKSEIRHLFDTQQSLLAQRLLSTGLEHLSANDLRRVPSIKHLLKDGDEGEIDDDALSFAFFNSDGQRLFSDGENGRRIMFESGRTGFVTQYLGKKQSEWRIVFMPNRDRSLFVAVGQEVKFRRKVMRHIIFGHLWPWLIILPLLILGMWWIIGRALAPVRAVASELVQRQADDDAPIEPQRVPREIRPLIVSLNTLFKRVTEMLAHARRFTADAAHELRSPLAALRVQAEVAQLAENDALTRKRALHNMETSIDRTAHLLEQLLALSRLDALNDMTQDLIDWRALAQTALDDVCTQAKEKNIELRFTVRTIPRPINGDPLLLALLLRNLLDNAIRYTPSGGQVELILDNDGLRVEDNGNGIEPEYLDRIRERFFRPPGQDESGSGLGLSIVEGIAVLHGLKLELGNRKPQGFYAYVIL